MNRSVKKTISLVTLFTFLCWNPAYSIPVGWEVLEGEASFNLDGNTLNITASDDSIIQYGSFDIGINETVNFFLPTADAFSLNRVIGGSGSSILGNLFSNGNIILINTSGLHFGNMANVDVAGLIASTHGLANADFLAGNYLFSGVNDLESSMTSILNEGSIRAAEGGMAILIADAIENRGVIEAPLGTVALAAGNMVSVGISSNGLIAIVVDEATAHTILDKDGNPITDQIKNMGDLIGNSGSVILNAQSAGSIFEKAINIEGIVRADTQVVGQDGIIEFIASGDILNAGNLEADFGSIEINTSGSIENAGLIETELFQEHGYTFRTHGTLAVAEGYYDNLDGAAYFSGSITGGTQNDTGNIIIDDASTISADTILNADSDNNGSGAFAMTSDASISGAFNLTITGSNVEAGSGDSITGNGTTVGALYGITGVTSLTLGDSGSGSPAVYTANSSMDIDGDFTLNSSTTLNANGQTMNVAGDWTNSGVFTHGNGKVIFDGTTQMSSGNYDFYDVQLGSGTSGGSLDLLSNMLIAGDFTVADGGATTYNISGDTAFFRGDVDFTNLDTFTSGSSTAQFMENSNLTSNGHSFFNVTISENAGNAVLTLQDEADFDGNLVFYGSATTAGMNLNSQTLKYSAPTMTLIDADSFSAAGSTVIFDGNTDLTSNGYAFGNIQIGSASSGGDLKAMDAMDIDGNLTVGNGGTTEFDIDGRPMNFGGDVDFTNLDTYSKIGAQLQFDGSSSQMINSGGLNFGDSTFASSGGLSLDGNSNFGTITMTSGSFDDSGYNLTASGLVDIQGGTFSGSSGGTQTLNGGLTVSGGDFDSESLDVNGDLNITAGTFTAPSEVGSFNLSGNVVRSGGGIFDSSSGGATIFDGTTQSINLNGSNSFGGIEVGASTTLTALSDLDINGNVSAVSGGTNAFIISSKTVDFGGDVDLTNLTTFTRAGSTVSFDGSSSQMINSGGLNFGDSTFASSGGLSLDGNSNFGTITMTSGSFDDSGYNLTASGLVDIQGGTFSGSSGGTQTLNGGLTVSGGNFDSEILDVNGDLNITSGTFTAPSEVGSFNLSGNLERSGGIFDSSGGGVTIFDGTTQTIDLNGSNSFGGIEVGANTFLTALSDLDINGNVSAVSGGTNAFIISSKTVDFGGDVDLINLTTFTRAGSTVSFDGSSSQMINSGGLNFGDSTFASSGGLSLDGNSNFGTITMTSGSFDDSGYNLTASGLVDIQGGTFSGSSGGTQTLNGGLTVNGGSFSSESLDINGDLNITSGTFTAPSEVGSFNLSGNFTKTGGTFSNSSGTMTFDGSSNITSGGAVFNDVEIAAASNATALDTMEIDGTFSAVGGTVGFDMSGQRVKFGGDVDMSGFTTFTTNATSTAEFDGDTTLTSGSLSLKNVDIRGKLTLGDNATFNGDLNFLGIGTGADDRKFVVGATRELTFGGANFNLSNAKVFNSTGSTVNFNTTTALTSNGKIFDDFTVKSGGNVTALDETRMAGNFDIDSSGSFLAPDVLRLRKNMTVDGTFTHNDGTVILESVADSTIDVNGVSAGTLTFHKLRSEVSGKDILVGSGDTVHINSGGQFYMRNVTLKSTGAGIWNLDADENDSRINVKDVSLLNSKYLKGAGLDAQAFDSTDLGGNTHWAFKASDQGGQTNDPPPETDDCNDTQTCGGDSTTGNGDSSGTDGTDFGNNGDRADGNGDISGGGILNDKVEIDPNYGSGTSSRDGNSGAAGEGSDGTTKNIDDESSNDGTQSSRSTVLKRNALGGKGDKGNKGSGGGGDDPRDPKGSKDDNEDNKDNREESKKEDTENESTETEEEDSTKSDEVSEENESDESTEEATEDEESENSKSDDSKKNKKAPKRKSTAKQNDPKTNENTPIGDVCSSIGAMSSPACQSRAKTKVEVYEGSVYVTDTEGELLAIIDEGRTIKLKFQQADAPVENLDPATKAYGQDVYKEMTGGDKF